MYALLKKLNKAEFGQTKRSYQKTVREMFFKKDKRKSEKQKLINESK
jgi:hypothetical protein